MKKQDYNPIKDNFHAIVQQKKAAGMPGHQALAETYSQAFPKQSIYKPAPGSDSPAQRKSSPFKGIQVKVPRNIK